MTSVDVIVPCYRYAHFLKECVASVLAQPGPCVRVLIIDDASPDNTAEVAADLAQQDLRVKFVRHPSNRGHIATYNEGIDWAEADYLLLLSADDYLLPGCLRRAVSFMDRHPDAGFVFGNAIEVDEQGANRTTDAVPCNQAERILTGPEFIVLSGARNIVPTPTSVVRTALQKNVGGYRVELPHSGDMEMWLRLAVQASVGFVKEPQAVYRKHGSNMSLTYLELSHLCDLEQRKAALDLFFHDWERIRVNSARLRAILFHRLACDAISHASAAFNDGELNLCKTLATFARHVSPKVTYSIPWAKLSCKRSMGLKLWRQLQYRAHPKPRT